MKKKPIYAVHLITKMGTIGLQPVKANTQAEARSKFKKRFPKAKILYIDKPDPTHKYYGNPI